MIRAPGLFLLLITAILLAGTAASAVPDGYSDRPTRLQLAAIERTTHFVTYAPGYRQLDYPGGDLPDSLGVCTDLIIRSYRALDIDLQVEVYQDMLSSFQEYPPLWGLTRPDRNIDHRRVPNLQVFLERQGTKLPASETAGDYLPGDLVTWMLPGNLPHIGIVTARRSTDGKRPLLAHNIGQGPVLEDMLLRFVITGHYRYFGNTNRP
ncbi:MAG: DUF1287 domain-containing protein [Candidatus Delongbacteria bacterium]|nr:DUF1287 domain-containing protein [Candidatus Delongbacteria bacterium]